MGRGGSRSGSGRRPLGPGASMNCGVVLYEGDWHAINQQALRERTSVSALVRRMVQAYLASSLVRDLVKQTLEETSK